MRKVIPVLLAISAIFMMLLSGCGEEPAYMHPYGPGVDPDSVVTKPYTPVTTTTSKKTTTTTDTTLPNTTTTTSSSIDPFAIPAGHVICPECSGVKIVCPICFGTDSCKVEVFDPDTGVFVRRLTNCVNCSEEDPGYMLCHTCLNLLYVPEE